MYRANRLPEPFAHTRWVSRCDLVAGSPDVLGESLINLDSLTVAGAAGALPNWRTPFPFHLSVK